MRQRLITTFVLFSLCWMTAGVSAQNLPVWSPSSSETPYLSAEVPLEHCALRLPAGFTLLRTTSFANGRKEYKFEGARRPDGSASALIVTAEIGQSAGPDWTVAEGMRDLLHTLDDTVSLDKVTDTQAGIVSGFPALRAYGKGDSLVSRAIDGPGILHHRAAHVIVYGVGDSRVAAIAVASDLEPHTGVYDTRTLVLMEASMQTLRLTDAPPPAPTPMAAAVPGQWLPRADLLPFLEPESVAGGVAIRLPHGFDLVTLDLSNGQKDPAMFGFSWVQRGSPTPAILRFIVQKLPADETPHTLAQIMTDLAAAEGLHQKGYAHSEIEYGVTGFGPAGRFTGAGNIPVIGNQAVIPRTCTVYGILTKTQFIRIEALTNDLNSAAAMQVMAASILTGHFASAAQ